MDLAKIKKVHFIGIGGIGMSALARMMLHLGKEVSGSDRVRSLITDALDKLGARIFIGHDQKNVVSDVDLVVYTIAIPKNNPELIQAKKLKITTKTYPKTLGFVSKRYKTIAVAGTHGKTTTTAMLTKILKENKTSPTVIVGSLLKDEKSNFVPGQSDIFLVEACEYQRSFLNLSPRFLIITNIDTDHLDYYKDLADIQSAFAELVRKIPKDGFLVCDPNHKNLQPVIDGVSCRIINYTQQKTPDKLSVFGEHNRANAAAALTVAEILGLDKKMSDKAVSEFAGTWRRMEYKGRTKSGLEIYDDYAHHPTEIRASLRGLRGRFPYHKIIAIFQPHLYSRTKALLDDFAESFSDADGVIVLPIYAAREELDTKINSKILAQKLEPNVKKVQFIKEFTDVVDYLNQAPTPQTIVITLGAGDISELADRLIQ